MTLPTGTYPFPLGGHPNGRYRQALTTASGCTAQQSNLANVGALSTHTVAPDPIKATYDNTPRIRPGEITAIRAWVVENGLLHSTYMDTYWKPGEIMRASAVSPHFGEGIHAFKTLERARDEYDWADVYGEVSLWGDVIEFEHGWKAEYAKVTKIYYTGGPFNRLRIWRLRRKYGVQ